MMLVKWNLLEVCSKGSIEVNLPNSRLATVTHHDAMRGELSSLCSRVSRQSLQLRLRRRGLELIVKKPKTGLEDR